MYCPNCGAFNEESYNNCTSCGRYIADINKEIIRQKENTSEPVIQNSETVVSEIKQIPVTPITITEKATDNSQDYPKQQERKYGESIYRQNIKKPNEYFIFSIICAALGSIAFGIAAVVFSAMTRAENISGNISKAGVYSEKTKIFCILSAVIGVLKYIFIIGILIYYYVSVNRYYVPYMW